MQIIKWYNRATLVLGLMLVGLYLRAMAGPFPAAHDGSGPSGEALAGFLLLAAAWAAIAHSAIVACVVGLLAGRDAARRIERKEVRWSIAAIATMGIGLAYPAASGALSAGLGDMRFRASAWHKLDEALQHGTPADVQAWLAKVPSQERTARGDSALVGSAVLAQRLDNLQALQARQVTIVGPDDETGWANLILAAVDSQTPAPAGAKTAMVRWLAGQGARFDYSLRDHSGELFETFAPIVDDAKRSGDTALFDTLVQHGADLGQCGARICPLWSAARFRHADQVAFLLAHGARVDRVDPQSATTALGEAVRSGDAAIARMLLAAGSAVAHERGRDDVVAACTSTEPEAPEVVSVLLAARARITPDQVEAARDELVDPALACVRRFEVR